MVKELACSDVGFECDHVVRGITEEDVMVQVAVHAKEDHPGVELTADVVDRARRSIQDL